MFIFNVSLGPHAQLLAYNDFTMAVLLYAYILIKNILYDLLQVVIYM